MTLKDYRQLAFACEALLKRGIDRPARLAFSALHFLGPHPAQLSCFEPPENKSGTFPWRFVLTSGIRMLAGWLAPNRISDLWEKNQIPKIRHLIVSHEIGGESGPRDFYFGQLPEWLAKTGGCVLVVKINHRGWRSGSLRLEEVAKGVYTMTLPGWATGKAEYAITGMVEQESRELRLECANQSRLHKNIWETLEKHSSRLAAAQNLRFYFWLKEIMQTLKPANLFFTWEGHAWERLLIRAARETNLQVLCIGYQHTILFPHAIGPFRSLGPRQDPDRIWTVGAANLRRLQSVWKKRGVRVFQYGSPRHRRYPGKQTQKKEDLCQIAPEGILPEAVRLFRFGLRLASLAPEIRFDFRCHPVLPFSRVVATCPELRQLPANVKIKNHSTPMELGRAKWFLYRGTSLVFEAVAAGARPLYLTKPGEISIDPLQNLKVWKRVVKTPQDALRQVKADKKNRMSGHTWEKKNAQRWARDFFLPENAGLPKSLELSGCRGRMSHAKD